MRAVVVAIMAAVLNGCSTEHVVVLPGETGIHIEAFFYRASKQLEDKAKSRQEMLESEYAHLQEIESTNSDAFWMNMRKRFESELRLMTDEWPIVMVDPVIGRDRAPKMAVVFLRPADREVDIALIVRANRELEKEDFIRIAGGIRNYFGLWTESEWKQASVRQIDLVGDDGVLVPAELRSAVENASFLGPR